MTVHGPVSLSATADHAFRIIWAFPIEPLGRLVADEVAPTLGCAA